MTPMNEFVEKYQQTCNQFFLDVCINDDTLAEYKMKQQDNIVHALNCKSVTKNNLEDAQSIHELFVRYQTKFQEMLDSSFVGLDAGMNKKNTILHIVRQGFGIIAKQNAQIGNQNTTCIYNNNNNDYYDFFGSLG